MSFQAGEITGIYKKRGEFVKLQRGCHVILSLTIAQKWVKGGTVRVTLNNRKLHNRNFPLVTR